MAELELVTLHEDAERLVLRGPGGVEHTLTITEALRAAVRRDRPRTEALRAQSEATLRPREVQARLRAGATVEDLAAESGLPEEHVRRYEWPVIAERDHVVAQVRAHRVDPESPTTLGELADRRLAARGVTEGAASWVPRRDGAAPWQVAVRFVAGDRDRTATWSFDPRSRAVLPVDDEARWLGQPDDPLSPEILGVPAERPAPRRPVGPDGADGPTDRLLDDLAGRRGQRPAPGRSSSAHPAGGGPGPETSSPSDSPARVVDLGARRDAGRSGQPEPVPVGADGPVDAPDPDPDPVPPEAAVRPPDRAPSDADGDQGDLLDGVPGEVRGDVPPPPPPSSATATDRGKAGRRAGRKGRPQVPSWDDIVFGGARPSS